MPGAGFAATLHGCLRVGAVMVPVSPRATEADLQAVRQSCASARREPGDVHVVFTSGTVGAPKGVRLTLDNHRASARGCQEALRSAPGERWLQVLSPHHVGGLSIFMRSVITGQPVITVPRFDETAVLQALAEEKPALMSAVPAMLVRLLEAGGLELLRRLRAILVGGAPAPAALVEKWAGQGLPVCPSYGLTETCSQVAVVPPGSASELAGSSGYAHSQARIEIVEGEVAVSGPVLSPGYLDRPISSPHRTGDLGFLDAGGALHVTGRRDDTIITGGEKVNPEEVEAVLGAHPGVLDAAVTGRPDPVYGQVLEARVVGDVPRPQELVAWCRERLPSFKVPRRVVVVEGLPRSEGGKLLRRLL